jgi:hypothetical protein
MGRGSYLGGSTIITPGRGGWSSAGDTGSSTREKRKKPKLTPEEKAKRKAAQEEKQLQNIESEMIKYARRCGLDHINGRPHPKVPKKLRSFARKQETEFQALVRSHKAYTPDEETRQKIARKNESEYAEACAAACFKSESCPDIPEYFRELFSAEELNNIVNFMDANPNYQSALKRHSLNAKRAEQKRDQQQEKMAKIIVEYVQK